MMRAHQIKQPDTISQDGRAGKVLAVLFSLLLLGATLWPVVENWRPEPRDDFPLSYYPMFSKPRGETAQVTYVLGIDERGREQIIHYRFVGSGGFNQNRKQLRKSVACGRGDQLCTSIARKVARRGGEQLADVDTVAIVTGTFDVDEFFRGYRQPMSLQLEAICKVSRPQP